MRQAISYSGLLCGSLLAITFGAAGAVADSIGQVVLPEYKGAMATADAAADAHEIKFQDRVQALDTVSTGDAGATSLEFLDQTHFDVGPNATVKLDSFVFDPSSGFGSGLIDMAVGGFRYVGGVMKNEEEIKLVTPVSVFTIRGSEVVFYIGIDGTTEIDVISGDVTAYPCGNAAPVKVPPGQRVIISPGCVATVTEIRSLAPGFAALEVPDDLGDFATAAGGDEAGADGAEQDHENADRQHEERAAPPAPEPSPPEPDPEPDPCSGCSP